MFFRPLLLVLVLVQVHVSQAWHLTNVNHLRHSQGPSTSLRMMATSQGESSSRASFLQNSLGWSVATAVATVVVSPPEAGAVSPMEYYRAWKQEEADALLGGELADALGRKTLPGTIALVPVAKLRQTLDVLTELIGDRGTWGKAEAMLEGAEWSPKEMKRAFNGYSDNLYMAEGDGRANQYLDGGASPSNTETLQYLLRNEAIGNVDALRAEVSYQIRLADKGGPGAASTAEEKAELEAGPATLKEYLEAAKTNFDDYLAMAGDTDREQAMAVAKGAQR